jgi:hypothetical protein
VTNHPSESLVGSQGACGGQSPATPDRACSCSQVLTLGVPDANGAATPIRPDRAVPEGGRLYRRWRGASRRRAVQIYTGNVRTPARRPPRTPPAARRRRHAGRAIVARASQDPAAGAAAIQIAGLRRGARRRSTTSLRRSAGTPGPLPSTYDNRPAVVARRRQLRCGRRGVRRWRRDCRGSA